MSRSVAPRAVVVVGTGGFAAVAPLCSVGAGGCFGPRRAAGAVFSISAAAAPSLAIFFSAVAPLAGSSVLALFLDPAAEFFAVAAAAAVVAVGASTVGAAPAPVVVLRPSLQDGSGSARTSVCHAGSVMPRPRPSPCAVRVLLRSVSSGSGRPRFAL